jgi:hypothetical protein
VLLRKDETAFPDSTPTLIQFLQADDSRLVRINHPLGLAIQPAKLNL